jgi:cation diffusion facilitator CzcD-associated flavoprotein CzcO
VKRIDTLIVGGGQAGLATSYCLTEAGRDHLVLEQGSTPAPVWRNERWDSFTLVTPNWALSLPGAEYDGSDPDGFTPLAGVIDYFDRYAAENGLPIQFDTRVESVTPLNGDGFDVVAGGQQYRARNVVIATGYTRDYSIVQAPVTDDIGFPIQQRGRTPVSGLYFAGMPWMPGVSTGQITGVAKSARHAASAIAEP